MATLLFSIKNLLFREAYVNVNYPLACGKCMGILNECGTTNLPNFEVEYAGYFLFWTSQIRADSAFDIIKIDQHNSCLYFCVLNLFILEACHFTSDSSDLSESHQRHKSPLQSVILFRKPYFSRSLAQSSK